MREGRQSGARGEFEKVDLERKVTHVSTRVSDVKTQTAPPKMKSTHLQASRTSAQLK